MRDLTGKGACSYRVVNLGCKVNRVESDSFEDQLSQLGCAPCLEGSADVVVVNTCTVTSDAEKKTRKAVRRALRENPQARVLVTGCSAAINGEQFSAMGENVRVVDKMQVAQALAEEVAGQAQKAQRHEANLHRVRRGVKLQDGCDNACTYCIVHVARGPSRSMAPGHILDECQRLLAEGLPEIMLTGINLGAYEAEGLDLAALLRLLHAKLPLEDGQGQLRARLRLSSIEPQNVTEDLAQVIADARGAICRHLHLPLQAGSSKVLRDMARHYDAEGFLGTVSLLKQAMPSVSISTDIIAGFPGETDDDFQESVRLARAVGFSKMHVFPYSMREGTPAAHRPDQVPAAVKEERARALRKLSDDLRAEDLALRANTTEWAAVEAPGQATTESYHDVTVPLTAPAGTLVPYAFRA